MTLRALALAANDDWEPSDDPGCCNLHDYRAAADPQTILALLDRIATLEAALTNCALAGRYGGEAMDAKHRGGRDKLAYIERTARAALEDKP